MSSSFATLGQIFFCILPVLSGCITENSLDSENLSRKEYVTLLPSVAKKDFVLRPDSGLFTDQTGTSLRLYLAKLNEEKGLSNIRLIPFSKSAENFTNTIIETRAPENIPRYTIGLRGKAAVVQLDSIRVEVFRYGVRFDGCKPNGGIAKFGCAVAVNRAMSLVNIQELEFGRTLAPADGELGSLPVSRLLEGKAAALSSGAK
ncbi:MAG: hypothetical protein V7750_04895 [Sneathiella sp.]